MAFPPGMNLILGAAVLFLLLNLAASLWRVQAGPTAADRMLATLLFGSTTVAVLLLLAERQGEAAFRDVAFLLVLLAAILTIAFIRVRGGGERP